MFESDFKVVADYFVQKRKNKDYIPSETKVKHVREVLQLMNVLTRDYRFEEAYNKIEKGAEINTMGEVLLDRIENREIEKGIKLGRLEGLRDGRLEGLQRGRIFEYIEIRREDGYSDEEICGQIVKRFGLTVHQAEEYMEGEKGFFGE